MFVDMSALVQEQVRVSLSGVLGSIENLTVSQSMLTI